MIYTDLYRIIKTTMLHIFNVLQISRWIQTAFFKTDSIREEWFHHHWKIFTMSAVKSSQIKVKFNYNKC